MSAHPAAISATDRCRIGATDVRVSRLGVGGGSLLNAIGADGVRGVLDCCWQAGLRHFDTAPFYLGGVSETRFGESLVRRPRDEFVLSTKIGRYIRDGQESFDYSAAATEASIAESLRRLKVERLDIVFIHDVTPALHGDAFEARFGEAMDGAAPVLARLREQGVLGAIGVGLADWDVALRFARTGLLDCVMLAGGYTLLETASAAAFLPYCAEHGISVLVAAPFNTGVLATGAIEGARFSYRPAPPEILARTRALEAVCARHALPLAAAALQFPLRHPAVASVVVGHQSEAEVLRNLALMAHPAPATLWDEMRALGLIPPDA
jgi:D-threo-aldose 1-dehydrogenase